MGVTNGVISASEPITVDIVNALIGRNSYDVVLLCTAGSAYVNKWARYKPVKVSQLTDITDLQRINANFGLDLAYSQITEESAALAAAPTIDWEYDAPEVGGYSRLTDFGGYNHYAQIPYSVSFEIINGAPNSTQATLRVYVEKNANADFDIEELGIFDQASGIGWGVIYKVNNIVYHYGYSFDDTTVDYPLTSSLGVDISVPATTSGLTVEAAAVIIKTNDGIFPLPNAYSELLAKVSTSAEYYDMSFSFSTYQTPTSSTAAKTYFNSNLVLITNSSMERSIKWELYIYETKGSVKETAAYLTGTLDMDTAATSAIAIGDDGTSGGYGIIAYENYTSTATYTYELRITVNNISGYRFEETGSY